MLGVFYCCGSNYFIGNIDNSMGWPLLTVILVKLSKRKVQNTGLSGFFNYFTC